MTKTFRLLGSITLMLCCIGIFLIPFFNNASNQEIYESPFCLVPIEFENGWGYEIKTKEKTIIYQDCIPSITGTKKFKSSGDAVKAGSLVIQKLKENKIPSISREELEYLKISIKH